MDGPLKNMYNRQSVTDLAVAIQQVYPTFDTGRFLGRVFDDDWEARELKERMRHITTVWHDFLPPDYRAALDILRRVLPSLTDYSFEKMVFPDYVEVYGLDDWEASIPVLEEFTRQAVAKSFQTDQENAPTRPGLTHYQVVQVCAHYDAQILPRRTRHRAQNQRQAVWTRQVYVEL